MESLLLLKDSRVFLVTPHGPLGLPTSLRKVPRARPRAGVTSRATIPGAQCSHAQGKPGRAKQGCVTSSGSECGFSPTFPNSCSSAQGSALPWDLSGSQGLLNCEHTMGPTPCPALCHPLQLSEDWDTFPSSAPPWPQICQEQRSLGAPCPEPT